VFSTYHVQLLWKAYYADNKHYAVVAFILFCKHA